MCKITGTSRALAMKSPLLPLPNTLQSFTPSDWEVMRQDLLPPSISQNKHGFEQLGSTAEWYWIQVSLQESWLKHVNLKSYNMFQCWINKKKRVWESCNAGSGFTVKSETVKPADLLSLSSCWMAFKKEFWVFLHQNTFSFTLNELSFYQYCCALHF